MPSHFEQDLREQICKIGRLMYEKDFVDGTSGNISARLDEDQILISPSGLAKGFLEPDHMLILNLRGERIDQPNPLNQTLRASSETPMHLECYRRRDDVGGVVHAHPAHAVALTIAGYDFSQCLIPELIILLGILPVAPYSTPSSDENRDAIQALILEHDALLLAHHGSLTVAKTVWEAYLLLETLEHGAKILTLVEQLGGAASQIQGVQLEKLLQQRTAMGRLRSGDRERMQAFLKPDENSSK